jgi:hypothetical protein
MIRRNGRDMCGSSGVVTSRKNEIHKVVRDQNLVVVNSRKLLDYSRGNEFDECNAGRVGYRGSLHQEKGE